MDSCYLGRYNNQYDAARDLIQQSNGKLTEPSEHRENSGCCGAGGAQMWMEETGSRINIMRTKDLMKTGSKTVATSCPFCITMITDAVKSEGKTDEVSVLDLAEIVERSL